jgi:hypothetical protein
VECVVDIGHVVTGVGENNTSTYLVV